MVFNRDYCTHYEFDQSDVRWMSESTFLVAKNFPMHTDIAEITNSTEIKDTTDSIAIQAIYNEKEKDIYLNISFKVNPDSVKVNLSISIKLIEESDDYCSEDEIFVVSKFKQLTRSVIFENIIAGCSYEVSINNSRNQHIYVKNYKVPDCVGTICICDYKPRSIKPNITCEQLSMNVMRITWEISKKRTMTNISTLHIRVIHVGNPNPVVTLHLNLTSKCVLSSCHKDVTVPRMLSGTHYKIESWYSNTAYCISGSARGYFSILAQSIKESQKVFQVMISMMFVIMVLVSLWLVWKKRHHCGCLPTDVCPSNILSTRNNSANVNKNFPVPMVDNHIYTEKEIEEDRLNGTVDKYEIGYKLLQLDRLIGGGAFGQVFKSNTHAIPNVSRSTPVAVKTLKMNASNDELEDFLREITMLKQIGNHPNIVTLLGCCTLRQPYCMVMEYIPCGDLLRYLHALRTYYERSVNHFRNNNEIFSMTSKKEVKHAISNNSLHSPPSILLNRLPSITKMDYTELTNLDAIECVLDPQDLQIFAEQIARGMHHLESKQIVHRDLAARNVLINENKVLKISDFGLSRRGTYVNSKQSKVPLRWLSVEAIRDYLYTSKSDVWAYGIVLWEIGTLGGFPYSDVSNEKILEYLLNGKRLNKPENITTELYSLMKRCWLLTTEERPSFTDVLNELKTISSKRRVYVDFSQLNPTYIFPPKTKLCTNINNTSDST